MTDTPTTQASLLVRLGDAADSAAWGRFVDLYAPPVYACARRHGLQDADAADVTQDVMRSVYTAFRRGDFDPDRGRFRPETWHAFWRTAVEGRPGKAVAAELGLTIAAVYLAKGRVMAALREIVQSVEN